MRLATRGPFDLEATVRVLQRRPSNRVDAWAGGCYRRVLETSRGLVLAEVTDLGEIDRPDLRCVLRGAVFEMSGIEGGDLPDDGFRIIRGGGVPALDVIGYNRRVDWTELVDRLQRVLDENVSPVVR